jgi:hypothetical protein
MARGGAHNGQTIGKQVTGIRSSARTARRWTSAAGSSGRPRQGILGFVPLYSLVDVLWPRVATAATRPSRQDRLDDRQGA